MGARPRRRRRAATKRRLRRWLRRRHLSAPALAAALVALALLVVALAVPRLKEEDRGNRVSRVTAAGKNIPEAAVRRAAAGRLPEARPRAKSRAPLPPPRSQAPRAVPPTGAAGADRFVEPRAAIVIDDLGQNFPLIEQLASLNFPISIAVIPGLPASDRTVSEATRRGIELLLHQPMEPHEEGGKDPGEGVLLTSMNTEDLRALVRENIAAVPGAVGVNNHMGSRFTEDSAGLGALMTELKAHGLFWLDSRTTAGTRGVEAARAAGVPALERDVFLDAEVNADFIRRQLRRLIATARARGTAVGIGHPHPETIAVLRELREELLASGVALVPVSALVRNTPATAPGTALAAARPGRGGTGERTAGPKTATP